MNEKQIISVMEQATGLEMDEAKLAAMVDQRVQKALSVVDSKSVNLGNGPIGPGLGMSHFLGDVRRLGMGQAPRHLSADELVRTAAPASLAKDLREGLSSAGGYLAPAEQGGEVLSLVNNYSAIKGLCREVPMRSRQITFPTVSGGLTAYWVPEATDTEGLVPDGAHQTSGEVVGSDATFGQLAITSHMLAVRVVVSNQLLDDSDPAVDGVLATLFAETIANAFDIACLRGAGAATDPISGLANLISTNALSVDTTFGFDDVADLIFAVYQNAPHAAEVPVIGHAKAEKVLMKLKDSGGDYIYRQPGQPRAETDNRPRVWGEPFVRDPNVLTNLGDGTDETRLFAGDFAGSGFVGVRQGLTIKTNPWAEPYFSYNQTCFLAEVRMGFAVSDEKRFAMLGGVPTA